MTAAFDEKEDRPARRPHGQFQPARLSGVTDWHAHWFSPTELHELPKRAQPPRITKDADGRDWFHPAPDASNPRARSSVVWPEALDVPGRLRHLDETSIQTQILSYAVPLGYDASIPVEEIRPFFRGINDDLADLVSRHPGRLLGLAALPTADPAFAAQELDRAHRELGFLGGELPMNAFAALRGAEFLRPVFEIAQRHGSHLLLHRGAASAAIPGQPALQAFEDTDWARASLLSDTQMAQAAITLALTDFLAPYPDVTIQLVMLGGAIPYTVEHIQQWGRFSGTPIDAAERLRRLYFDPGPYSVTPRSVKAAVEAIGADRILFGSDFGPMPSIQPALDALDAALSPHERELIYVENGRKLLAAKGKTLAVAQPSP